MRPPWYGCRVERHILATEAVDVDITSSEVIYIDISFYPRDEYIAIEESVLKVSNENIVLLKV